MHKIFALLLASTVLGTVPAAAAVYNVKSVKITNVTNDYIQVAELLAFEAGTGTNVALASNGGVATGSPLWNPATTPGKANDGIFPSAYPNIFHSLSGAGAFLLITFDDSYDLSGLQIFGRTDLPTRDNFNFELFSASGASLLTGGLDARLGSASVDFGDIDPVPGVPEPVTWAMLITGFGLVGAASRRRRLAAHA